MAAVCGTSGIASLFSRAAFAAESDIADGKTVRFDFSVLQSMAHDLAQKPWGGAPRALPDTLAKLTPQAYNSIQYDAEQSLWNNVENRQLDAQFFHVGMGFRRRVRMFSVDGSTHMAREIHFRPELFKYNDAGVDTKALALAAKNDGWLVAPGSLFSPRLGASTMMRINVTRTNEAFIDWLGAYLQTH